MVDAAPAASTSAGSAGGPTTTETVVLTSEVRTLTAVSLNQDPYEVVVRPNHTNCIAFRWSSKDSGKG